MLGKVLLITGGEVDLEFVRKYIDSISYDTVICADSGLNTAYRLKLPVHYFMGDFDSVTPQILESYRNGTVAGSEACEWVRYPKEKDYVDTQLVIEWILEKGALEIHILGATGGRYSDASIETRSSGIYCGSAEQDPADGSNLADPA